MDSGVPFNLSNFLDGIFESIMFKNVIIVESRSLALIIDSEFDQKYYSYLLKRNRKMYLENFGKFISQEQHITILI